MLGEHLCGSYHAMTGCNGCYTVASSPEASKDESDDDFGSADDAEDDDDGSPGDDEMST